MNNSVNRVYVCLLLAALAVTPLATRVISHQRNCATQKSPAIKRVWTKPSLMAIFGMPHPTMKPSLMAEFGMPHPPTKPNPPHPPKAIEGVWTNPGLIAEFGMPHPPTKPNPPHPPKAVG
jgi:hypothetical protein